MTEARTITLKNGKTVHLKRHVVSAGEVAEAQEDTRFMKHKRSLVTGFSVKGKTVFVLTNLTSASREDAQELCHNLGAFVFAKTYRQFGLENITVLGSKAEILSSRMGLRGNVR